MSKLSKAQQGLLDALKAGVRVLRSGSYPKYWMRADMDKKCTATANSLYDLGLVEVHRANPPVRFFDHELRVKQPIATRTAAQSSTDQQG